ncbi:hypothetical protein AA3250_3009 [Gluconobacter albidus NBRC 3250]|nr:hypothetical protein AA3250_3009 [Gluconobacter albidus NBRC 3250]
MFGLDDHEGTGQKDEMVNLGCAITRGLGKTNVMEAWPSQIVQEGADPVFAFRAFEFGLKALPGCVRAVAPLDARGAATRPKSQAHHTKARLQAKVWGLVKRMACLWSGKRYPDSSDVLCDFAVSLFGTASREHLSHSADANA